ncbi:MAG: DNA-binding protein [Lachnospiraceae bacterium]|nr:DNA-binding protein [Lachnospiraceae bacterium]
MEKSGIEERVELSMLYDFYGALLKESQKRMFEMSILEDYGYSEIAQEEGISRQGVYDAIKRAIKQLREYEEKLGLVARFEKQKRQIKTLQRQLVEMGVSEKEEWQTIFALLHDIVDV